MCGIAGTLNFAGQRADRSVVESMIAQLSHRGPDATGVHLSGPAGLGHARLSIIDVACGQQPMTVDGDLWITFNGEIFNYIELRDQLIAKGYRFQTHSDTEVILQLFRDKGEDCVRFLNGQWAFAIWNARTSRLFLSRDRMGVRPLFYTRTSSEFIFASEIKAIFAHSSAKREVDLEALNQIFTFWHSLPPRTFFKDVKELPPGHSMTIDRGEVSIRSHWQPAYDVGPCEIFDKNAEQSMGERLLELLIDATRIRLRSDVPVGAYLSGGLDSTVIVALIRKFTDNPLRTFSITFDDPEFDESPHQEEAIRFLGTDHQSVRCTHEQIGEAFPDVIWHTEKPILRTAPVPLYLLSRLVRQHDYKVVLTGEGSDEVLGGYDIFKEAKIRRFWGRVPNSAWRPRLLKRLYPYLSNIQSQSDAYLKAFFHVRPEELDSPFFSHLPRWELTSKLKQFFSDDVRESVAAGNPYGDIEAALPAEYGQWSRFAQSQYLEITQLLPGYILSSQGDRMAMANSVEGRFPFLDHRVVEFAGALPASMKMKVLCEKYLLKRCTAGLIPASVTRRTKQPYRAPEGKSFFGGRRLDYVEDLLSPAALRKSGLFDPATVQKLKEKCASGRAIGIKDNMAIVGIISAQLVMEQFVHNFHRKVIHAVV